MDYLRRRRGSLGLPLIGLALLTAAVAQERESGESGALIALSSNLAIEQTLLDEDLASHAAMAGRRAQLTERLPEMYAALDHGLHRQSPDASDRIATLLEDIERLEAQRQEHLVKERALVERIGERKRRIVLIEARIASLASRQAEVAGALSGTWDVVLLPSDLRGAFELRQSGTLVSGTYRLGGAWTGSLQGTLVERKVYLVRIDSKLGRSMEFEGVLSTDGDQIRGSWLSYELAGSAGGTGSWSARRRADSP